MSTEQSESLNGLTTAYSEIITGIGEDLRREGLARTPQRAKKAIMHLTRGYRTNLDEIVNGAIFHSENDEMVIVRNIELYSLCEHHLLPFVGKCHVGYLPQGKVLGLSKVARIVDMYACRLQIQESLTYEIACAIQKVVDTQDVGVVVEAKHMCMMMRGVEKQNSVMTTSAMFGRFRSDQATRSEFLSLIANPSV